MAKAIDNAYCVLICITEKYRQSTICQAEALYAAFHSKKPVVPLIMEAGFEEMPRGWLGDVLVAATGGDRKLVNFAKDKYEECIRMLKEEIQEFIDNNSISLSRLGSVASMRASHKFNTSVVNWSEDEVREWFEAVNVDKALMETLLPSNGALLRQLYDMKQKAPEFYFQSLNESGRIKLKSILLFSELLEKLFC